MAEKTTSETEKTATSKVFKFILFVVVYAVTVFISKKLLLGVVGGTLYNVLTWLIIPLFMSLAGIYIIGAVLGGILTLLIYGIVSVMVKNPHSKWY